MSAPAEPSAAAGKNGDRRMSLGKYVKRMSSVFRREKQGKSSDSAAPAAPSVSGIQKEVTKEGASTEEAAPAT